MDSSFNIPDVPASQKDVSQQSFQEQRDNHSVNYQSLNNTLDSLGDSVLKLDDCSFIEDNSSTPRSKSYNPFYTTKIDEINDKEHQKETETLIERFTIAVRLENLKLDSLIQKVTENPEYSHIDLVEVAGPKDMRVFFPFVIYILGLMLADQPLSFHFTDKEIKLLDDLIFNKLNKGDLLTTKVIESDMILATVMKILVFLTDDIETATTGLRKINSCLPVVNKRSLIDHFISAMVSFTNEDPIERLKQYSIYLIDSDGQRKKSFQENDYFPIFQYFVLKFAPITSLTMEFKEKTEPTSHTTVPKAIRKPTGKGIINQDIKTLQEDKKRIEDVLKKKKELSNKKQVEQGFQSENSEYVMLINSILDHIKPHQVLFILDRTFILNNVLIALSSDRLFQISFQRSITEGELNFSNLLDLIENHVILPRLLGVLRCKMDTVHMPIMGDFMRDVQERTVQVIVLDFFAHRAGRNSL